MDTLKENLAGCGIDLDVTSSGSLHDSLRRVRASHDEDVVQVGTSARFVWRVLCQRGQSSHVSEPTLHIMMIEYFPL